MANESNSHLYILMDGIIFQSEPIRKREPDVKVELPPLLAKARAMEKNARWNAKPALFLKQAKLLADYEDDFEYHGKLMRYLPTYQSLTDKELRGYFTWRAKARKGEYAPTSMAFIFLYIYELLNNVGVANAEEGYQKLIALNRQYGSDDNDIPFYMEQWLCDYVIYYGMDPGLLEDNADVAENRCMGVLERLEQESPDRIMDALKHLAPKWLKRSKFYAEHSEEMDAIIVRVLKRMSVHYGSKCKKNLMEQFFGRMYAQHKYMFNMAVFCDPLARSHYEYKIDDQCVYKCKRGIWTIKKRNVTPGSIRKLEKLFKTIDSIARSEFGYGRPVKVEMSLKWLETIIREETRKLLLAKSAPKAEKFTIDLSRLGEIRANAALTRDKLIVDEEMDAPANAALPQNACDSVRSDAAQEDSSLTPVEKRLLATLLAKEDLSWLKDEGLMLSVLVDAINEKLYDVFGDTVIDDSGDLVEDYREELKEMIA